MKHRFSITINLLLVRKWQALQPTRTVRQHSFPYNKNVWMKGIQSSKGIHGGRCFTFIFKTVGAYNSARGKIYRNRKENAWNEKPSLSSQLKAHQKTGKSREKRRRKSPINKITRATYRRYWIYFFLFCKFLYGHNGDKSPFQKFLFPLQNTPLNHFFLFEEE